MNTYHCQSVLLSSYLDEFIEFKQQQSYKYKYEIYLMKRFDHFLTGNSYGSDVLSKEIVQKYINSTASMGSSFRFSCLSCLRVFSRFLNAHKPESYVIGDLPFKRKYSTRFYLYTRDEVLALMNATEHLSQHGILRRPCIRFLIGLLSCTGLRINEALSLTLEDVDLPNQRLFIRDAKFGKQRYIPLHKTTVCRMEQWLSVRSNYVSDSLESYLFVTDSSGKKLNYQRADRAFIRCRTECKMESGGKAPRMHDMRHTYACNCLFKWQDSEADIRAKLPILSTAMGHVSIKSTQVYLHVTPAQLQKASTRFYTIYNEEK